jgi:EF hand
MTAPMKSTVAVLALMGTVLAAAAFAQGGPEGGPEGRGPGLQEMFASIDADANGLVTEAELEAHRSAEFTAADTNGDGLLSADELSARALARFTETQAARTARMIDNQDNNGDGSLALAELDEGPMGRNFARIDTDNDGAISQAEAEAMGDRMGKHRRGGHGND